MLSNKGVLDKSPFILQLAKYKHLFHWPITVLIVIVLNVAARETDGSKSNQYNIK